MRYAEKLDKILKHTQECSSLLRELIQKSKDYDLERVLKKVDAQLIDARHNLVLAQKIAKGKREK
jgi:ATP-dependent protease HslVU (ClpYQ) peptidase subunit